MATLPGNPNPPPPNKVNYGIDAPGVIRNILIGAFLCFLFAGIGFFVNNPLINDLAVSFAFAGFSLLPAGLLMLRYSLHGKYKYREYLLNSINWKGNEQVLDVGTGKGLLMVGAAKRLTTGRSYGIDIWNKEDLTGNNAANALQNALIEGVADKVQVENVNVISMDFGNNTFDVVISNLCLHNIYNKEDRRKACMEIYRVLKPSGIAIISDFKHTREYDALFKELGMKTAKRTTSYFTTFPPLSVVKAEKL